MKSLLRLMMTFMVGTAACLYAASASENRMEPRGWRENHHSQDEPRGWRDDRNTTDVVDERESRRPGRLTRNQTG